MVNPQAVEETVAWIPPSSSSSQAGMGSQGGPAGQPQPSGLRAERTDQAQGGGGPDVWFLP